VKIVVWEGRFWSFWSGQRQQVLLSSTSKLRNLSNHPTIAISGATRGIGRAIAIRFAQAGWRVAIAARTTQQLATMKAEWARTWPEAPLLTCAADLTTGAACQHFARELTAAGWRADVLVNNLGYFAPGTLLEGEEQQLEQFLRVNVLSAHYLSRAFLPQLRAGARAHLFTIGSVAVYDRPAPMAAYMLSKQALHTWHQALRTELANTSIRTTLVVPGATYTSSWDGVDVDPQTLLAPETVAAAVWQAWADNEIRDTEEVILRPLIRPGKQDQ
jgi:short-subunit dehydrogenase